MPIHPLGPTYGGTKKQSGAAPTIAAWSPGAALTQVAAVESNPRELRLTALPKPGSAGALPAVSELIARNGWDVPELHLEPGRLDEVFRTLTQPQSSLETSP